MNIPKNNIIRSVSTRHTPGRGNERPQDAGVVQAQASENTDGQGILEDPVRDPLARWLDEGPAEAPWHKVHLADNAGSYKPKYRSSTSDTGATAGSKKHGARFP